MALSKITKSLFLIAGVCQIENGISGTNAITLKRMVQTKRPHGNQRALHYPTPKAKVESLFDRVQNLPKLETMLAGVRKLKNELAEPSENIASLESNIRTLMHYQKLLVDVGTYATQLKNVEKLFPRCKTFITSYDILKTEIAETLAKRNRQLAPLKEAARAVQKAEALRVRTEAFRVHEQKRVAQFLSDVKTAEYDRVVRVSAAQVALVEQQQRVRKFNAQLRDMAVPGTDPDTIKASKLASQYREALQYLDSLKLRAAELQKEGDQYRDLAVQGLKFLESPNAGALKARFEPLEKVALMCRDVAKQANVELTKHSEKIKQIEEIKQIMRRHKFASIEKHVQEGYDKADTMLRNNHWGWGGQNLPATKIYNLQLAFNKMSTTAEKYSAFSIDKTSSAVEKRVTVMGTARDFQKEVQRRVSEMAVFYPGIYCELKTFVDDEEAVEADPAVKAIVGELSQMLAPKCEMALLEQDVNVRLAALKRV